LKQNLVKKGISEVQGSGTPFLVKAENQRIYAGAFWSLTSSAIPDFPTICVIDKTLKIFQRYPIENTNDSSDPINDARIYKALKKTGKLEQS